MGRLVGDCFIQYNTLAAVDGENQQTLFIEADDARGLIARLISTLSQIPDLTPPWTITHHDLAGGGHGEKYVMKLELARNQGGVTFPNGAPQPFFSHLYPLGMEASDHPELVVHRQTAQAQLAALFASTPTTITVDTVFAGAALGHRFPWTEVIAEFFG